MQRHHHGVVDVEILHERDVEAMLKGGRANVGRERTRHRDRVVRHRGLVVWPCGGLCDANRECREIVEKERVEMIIREHDQHIRCDRSYVPGDFSVKTSRFAVWSFARNLGGKSGRVRHRRRRQLSRPSRSSSTGIRMLSIFSWDARNYSRAVRRETAPRHIASQTIFLKIAKAPTRNARASEAAIGTCNECQQGAHATSTGAQWAPVDVVALQK